MKRTDRTTGLVLSWIVAALACLASAGGLFIRGVYRDNRWAATQWAGNDAVTLFVAVPALVLGLALSMWGSRRARIVWIAILHYMVYNYAFYLFGSAFNSLFLAYAAIFATSILALVFALPAIDVDELAAGFAETAPARAVAAWLVFIALGLGGLWTAMSVGFILSGVVPKVVADSGHPTSVVFAVDLGLLVPYLILGGSWLYRRKPWGYVLGTALSLSAATYTLALAAMGISADKTVVAGAAFLVPLWLVLSLASLGSGIAMLARFKPRRAAG
jgi:hypothetical protein